MKAVCKRSDSVKKTILYTLWGCLYVLCVGLGTADDPQGLGKVLFVLTGLIFFLPPLNILYTARKNHDRTHLLILRVMSGVSLAGTAVLLVLNFLSVGADAETGRRLYELLNLFSAPMVCIQYWAVSLFLWACLFWGSFRKK